MQQYTVSLVDVQTELEKRLSLPYRWNGKKQNNADDEKSNFIYSSHFFAYIFAKIQKDIPELSDYALNRWYNYWSAKGVEAIFTAQKNIVPEKNKKHKYKDFMFVDRKKNTKISFDHKTTQLPKCFEQKILHHLHSSQDCSCFTSEVIQWLYENQSQEGRQHWENRFFIVLVDTQKKEHWKMKAKLCSLNAQISDFLQTFSLSDCMQFTDHGKIIYSHVFWVVQ